MYLGDILAPTYLANSSKCSTQVPIMENITIVHCNIYLYPPAPFHHMIIPHIYRMLIALPI